MEMDEIGHEIRMIDINKVNSNYIPFFNKQIMNMIFNPGKGTICNEIL